jgi:peptidoglycan/LPS O-acetylase OafA/YrhL
LLLFTAVLYALHIGQKPSSGQIAAVLLFYQNYVPWHIIGHTWSIAVEEHFYFLLVLLLAWLSRRKSGNCFTPVPAIAAGLALASLIFRIVTATVFPYDMYTNLFATHLRLDSLFFGVFISYLYHHYPDKFLNLVHCRRSFLLLCGVLALLPPYLFEANKTPFLYTFGFTLYYLGSGCLLSAFLSMNLDSTKRGISLSGTLAYIGSHSYSIYLWHVPVNFWLVPYLQGICAGRWNWWYYFATYFFGSIIFGICMALLIEFPILKARDKWFPSRGRPLSVAATG